MAASEQGRPRRRLGRPPGNRNLQPFEVQLSDDALSDLDAAAASLGVGRAAFVRLVVAQAYGIPWNPIDLNSKLTLPIPVEGEALRAVVSALEPPHIHPPRDGVAAHVRLDPDLSDAVKRRARELGAAPSRLLSVILSIAVGAHPGAPVHQPSLLEDSDGATGRIYRRQGARLAS